MREVTRTITSTFIALKCVYFNQLREIPHYLETVLKMALGHKKLITCFTSVNFGKIGVVGRFIFYIFYFENRKAKC